MPRLRLLATWLAAPATAVSRRRALSRLGLMLLGLALPAVPASAGVLPGEIQLRGAVEWGFLRFDELADYTFFAPTLPPGPGQLRLDLRDEAVVGLRLGVRLNRQVDLTWSRFQADSRYRVFEDGREVTPDEADAAGVLLPRVDVRFDLISLGMRIERWRRGPVVPVVRLGYGWVLLSQDGPIDALRRGPENFSDSDKVIEASAGLVARVGPAEAGLLVRTFHFRFDPDNGFIPPGTTHPWMLSIWGGAAF